MISSMVIVHVISGFAALFCGLVAVTALYLSVVKVIPFLFLIAIFSYYLTWTGYKAIHWKNKELPTPVFWFDAVITHLVAFFGVLMITLALLVWAGIHINQTISSLKIVLLIFGIGTCIFAGEDLKLFYQKSNKSKFLWMYTHIGRMLGAYIATFTAFLVVNDQFFPSPLIAWLAPTVFGTPLIFYWIRKYRLKMEPRKAGISET